MHRRRIVGWLMIIQLSLTLISSGSSSRETAILTRQMDITTPLTTVPITNTDPILNPTDSNPDSPSLTNPINPPAATTTTVATPPPSTSRSWCIASRSASQTSLQVALDYACGIGGADCLAIQGSGNCYNPNTVRDHASYAFNSYYQKNPVPNSCNFGGTAVTTNTDPSIGTCRYQSTSTSSSILNTTNSNGSTVFGSGPRPVNPSSASAAAHHIVFTYNFILTCSVMLLLRNNSH